MKKRLFPLVEILLVSAVIGTTVITPCRALAASEPHVFTVADVEQVYNPLKKMSDALTSSLVINPQTPPRSAFLRLVADGFLAAIPPAPIGIGDASGNYGTGSYGAWSNMYARIGGCGPKNNGEKRTFNILLSNVNDEFCKTYNKVQGLGSIIAGNCLTKPDAACLSSGSKNGDDPVNVGKNSFCFKTSDSINFILFNTGVAAPGPCEQ